MPSTEGTLDRIRQRVRLMRSERLKNKQRKNQPQVTPLVTGPFIREYLSTRIATGLHIIPLFKLSSNSKFIEYMLSPMTRWLDDAVSQSKYDPMTHCANRSASHYRMTTGVVAVFTTELSDACTCTAIWCVPIVVSFGTLTLNWKRWLRAS